MLNEEQLPASEGNLIIYFLDYLTRIIDYKLIKFSRVKQKKRNVFDGNTEVNINIFSEVKFRFSHVDGTRKPIQAQL